MIHLNRPLIIIFSLLGLVGLLTVFFALLPNNIKVVTINPGDQSNNFVLSTEITATLNQPINSESDIHLTLEPAHQVRFSLSPDKKTVTFSPLTLFQPNTTYRLTLTGPRLQTFTSQFTTLVVPSARSFFSNFIGCNFFLLDFLFLLRQNNSDV